MKAAFLKVISALWERNKSMLSETGDISMGRASTWFLVRYFCLLDMWFYHRSGHFVDTATLIAQFCGVAFVPYFGNKTQSAVTKIFAGETTNGKE